VAEVAVGAAIYDAHRWVAARSTEPSGLHARSAREELDLERGRHLRDLSQERGVPPAASRPAYLLTGARERAAHSEEARNRAVSRDTAPQSWRRNGRARGAGVVEGLAITSLAGPRISPDQHVASFGATRDTRASTAF